MLAIKSYGRMLIDGFTNNQLARNLLIIVLIKLLLMFLVIKVFFFQDFLGSRFESDDQKADYVIEQLTKTGN